MATKQRSGQLKVELDPRDEDLLKHMIESLTRLVSGMEAIQDSITTYHLEVRAALPRRPGDGK